MVPSKSAKANDGIPRTHAAMAKFVVNAKRLSTMHSTDSSISTTSPPVNCVAACWYDIPLQMMAINVTAACGT
jgi:hypothetical protein